MSNKKRLEKLERHENKASAKNRVIAIKYEENIYHVDGKTYTKDELEEKFKDDELIVIRVVNDEPPAGSQAEK